MINQNSSQTVDYRLSKTLVAVDPRKIAHEMIQMDRAKS